MFTRNGLILGSALVISGCMSYEGLYAPGCLAYSGSEIGLGDGRYVWRKFTDQVVVDADGSKVDPFPGYPREGQYLKQGNQVLFAADGSEPAVSMFIYRVDGEQFLYTADEAAAFEATGERPACPLKLQPPE